MKNGNPHSAQKASSEGPRLDIFIQHDEVYGSSPDFMMGVLEQSSAREEKMISYMIPRADRKCQASKEHRHLNGSRIVLLLASITREGKRPSRYLNMTLKDKKSSSLGQID